MCGVNTTWGNVVSGWSVARCSPFEVVEARRADLARGQCGDQRVGVVDLGPGRVEVDDAVAHLGEGVGVDEAGRLRRHGCVNGDDVRTFQELVQRAGGVGRVRVVGEDVHAQAAQAPAQRPARPPRARPGRPSSRSAPRPGSAGRGSSRRGRSRPRARRDRRGRRPGWRRRGGRRPARPRHRRCVPERAGPAPRPRWRPPRRRWWDHRGSCTRPGSVARRGRPRRRRSPRSRCWPPPRPPARPAGRRCRCARRAGPATNRARDPPVGGAGRGRDRSRRRSPEPWGGNLSCRVELSLWGGLRP